MSFQNDIGLYLYYMLHVHLLKSSFLTLAIIVLCSGMSASFGQNPATQNNTGYRDTLSSDDLIVMARKAAFEEKDYSKAKGFLYRAYAKSPRYADVQIFLGRIYTWTNQYDSAKYFFESALKVQPGYEDIYNAYSDLEYYHDHYPLALALVEGGLITHPESTDLKIRKTKILIAMKEYSNAGAVVKDVLKTDIKNKDALQLNNKIRLLSAYNEIAVGYDFSYFDKQFTDPWHLVSAEYGRVTDIGKVIGRVNYANRFKNNSTQFEIDAYPHISKTFYAYMNMGFPLDSTTGIFPRFRAGFSLYANLPAAFEAELGIRYLKFTGSPVNIYTASLGKYIKNWLYTGRIYLVPSDYSNTNSVSFSLTGSYYIGGTSADDVIGGTIGYGSSPDDRSQGILAIQNLKRYKVSAFYKKTIAKFNVLSLSTGFYAAEYFPGLHGNEYDFGISWLRRF